MAEASKRFEVRPLLVDPQFWKCPYKGAGHGITSSDLDGDAGDVQVGDIILVYTGSNEPALQDDNVRRYFSYLEESGADWSVNHKVKCVGIDSLRVENYGFVEGVVHKKLLVGGVGIVEGLSQQLKNFVGRRMFSVCLLVFVA
jgi:kynurenine formamidase